MTHGGLITTVKTATSEGNDGVGVCIRWADELADPQMDPLVCSRRETHAYEGEMTTRTMLSPRRVVLVPGTGSPLVRVRVNASVGSAGHDRVRVSNQDVVETGYAPSS
jgi:hypothetical protein